MRRCDLRVFVVYCSSTNDKVDIILHIGCIVPDVDGNSFFPQQQRLVALVHIGTDNDESRVMQHFRQRRHGHTANADEQTLFPGNEILFKIHTDAPKSFEIGSTAEMRL